VISTLSQYKIQSKPKELFGNIQAKKFCRFSPKHSKSVKYDVDNDAFSA